MKLSQTLRVGPMCQDVGINETSRYRRDWSRVIVSLLLLPLPCEKTSELFVLFIVITTTDTARVKMFSSPIDNDVHSYRCHEAISWSFLYAWKQTVKSVYATLQ